MFLDAARSMGVISSYTSSILHITNIIHDVTHCNSTYPFFPTALTMSAQSVSEKASFSKTLCSMPSVIFILLSAKKKKNKQTQQYSNRYITICK